MTAPPVGPVASVELGMAKDDTGTRYSIPNSLVALESPALGQPLGLPTSGRGQIALDVHVTGTDLRTAEGAISLGCPAGCVLGDDKSNLHIAPSPSRAMFGPGGLAFGHLTVDHFAAKVTVGHGRADLASFEWASPDVELLVSGGVTLAAALDKSQVDVCVRFKPSEALRVRDPKTYAMLSLTGAPLDPDGRYDIRIEGSLGEPKRLGLVCGGATEPPTAPLDTAATPTPTPTPTPAATRTYVPEPDTGSDEVSLETAARLDAGIHATGPTTFDVGHALVDLAWPGLMSHGARIVPAVRDGKLIGFKLYAIRVGSIYARLGMQNGDTFEAADGRSLATPDDALAAYAAVKKAAAGKTIVLTGTRRGEPLTLTYHLR